MPSRPNRTPKRYIRRRLALAAGVLTGALAIAVALVLLTGGSGPMPPATGAATIVPANALAYVSLSTDPSRPAVSDARRMAARFPDWPLLETAALNRLRSLVAGSSSADFATQIRPWLGKQASIALIGGPNGVAEPLVVLEVAQAARARAFVNHAGATPAGAYDGVRIMAYPSGTELAFVGHYLVAGPDAGVRAALDAARGRARALAHDSAYERAVAGEPADRVLDAYLPAAGIHQLLATRTGVAGAIGALLDRPALQGAAISLSPSPSGARVQVHSVLGGAATRVAARSFTPTLQSVLPSGSTLMLDVDGLSRAAPGLLSAAATAGIAGNVGPLLHRVGSALTAQRVNVGHVVSLFDGETAVAISPGPTPGLLIVSRVRDQAAAQSELAALQGPVTALFSPSGSAGGQVPELADRVVGGATVHEVGLGPGLQLDYAVFNGLVVVSTSVSAIDGVAQRSHALASDAAYRATLPDQPPRLTSLVFGDVSQLLQLGGQTGLTSGAGTRALLPDLSKIRAIGLSSTSGERDTTTELSLEIR
ncbi:MAG TPA: DUF3352 domain-containing protein [Solirubrobacteraceae bacterium]|nr:DUF3352 domain-containing protein [Solirubrobacteraceae bacterium]